ncbi:MAG: PPOX class F420-dependent oxidoreductase [Acidimicrobiia bacterium]|nr:PPOX class F420-dependent oxidoreductase [Acidimicrobiia bacterium]
MVTLSPETRSALTAGRLAHLVTVNADGSPQVSLVWVGLEDDEIVCGHLGQGQKTRNIERDPRVVLSMETEGRNEMGLDHYLIVHGTARITDGGGPELLQRLAEVYLGPGVKFPPFDNPPPGRVIRIAADRVGGVGPWATTG